MENIKVLTWNVNGLGNPIKRKKVMSILKKERAQIVYLQETHLSKEENLKLKGFGFTKLYFSTFRHSRKRGVTIRVNNTTKFECHQEINDK